MGREIRRVPPNWEHPKDEKGNYVPMYDQDFKEAAEQWLHDCIAWNEGTHEDLVKQPSRKQDYPYFWMWHGPPPSEDCHRPKFDTEPSWFQIYETVSEGTPVTPPFATKEELIEYLVSYGDFWDQNRGDGGWTRGAAEKFVTDEYAPSLTVTHTEEGTTIKAPRDE